AAERANAINWYVGVDRRVAAVAGGLVMDEVTLAPILDRQDDIALDAFRTRRNRWQFAVGDTRGPVGIHLQAPVLTEVGHVVLHLARQALAVIADRHVAVGAGHLDALAPALDGVAASQQGTGRLVTQLVAEHALLFHVL